MLVSWMSFGISVAGRGLLGLFWTAMGEVLLVLWRWRGDRVWGLKPGPRGGGRAESNEPGRE